MSRNDPLAISQENYARVGITPGPRYAINSHPVEQGRSADLMGFLNVCEICHESVNRMYDADGQIIWLHSRSYIRYNHDPKPIQIPRGTPGRKSDCDFCGTHGYMKWAYEGDVMEQRTGNTVQNYGHIWASCTDCAVFIEAGDIDGLNNRVMTHSIIARGRTAPERQEISQSIRELHERFLPTVHRRNYIGPPVEPAKLTPRHLPKLQTGLSRFWNHPGLFTRMNTRPCALPGIHAQREELFAVSYQTGEIDPDAFARHTQQVANGTSVASLYWISEDFTSLATQAGQDLEEITMQADDLPSRFGLLVWARPIGEIQRPFGTAGIRAVSWSPIPGGIWVNVYVQTDDADPEIDDIAAWRSEWGWLMAPNVGVPLPFGALGRTEGDARHPDNFLLTMFATWFLMKQPGVAEETSVAPDKALARSYKRANKKPPEVKLIDLRRHVRRQGETAEEAEARRSLSVRFMVKGHWRNQAYGPKRGLRRMMYISPFVKGPDGAPLKGENIPVVKVLR